MNVETYRDVVRVHIVFYVITLVVLVALGLLTWNFFYLVFTEVGVIGMLLVLFCREWIW